MGLNDFEVKQRIKKYGYNEIAKDNVKKSEVEINNIKNNQ